MNTTMTKTAATVLAICLIALSGCDENRHDDVQVALSEAQKLNNPWEAVLYLREKHASSPALEYVSAGVAYYEAALNEMDPGAVFDLFQRSTMAERRASFVPKILAAADAASGNDKDRKLLYTAGLILTNGDYAVRDAARASEYLAKAWAAGESRAAADAARLYRSINDFRNAYLWSLRCINQCARDTTIELSEFEGKLSPEAAKQAQKAALDPTVIELPLGR
jgi:hypothetical protein